jgi:hypothetical protein
LLGAVKTLPPESLSFLKDLMTRINTQDNRCTASPFYYVIHERVECATAEEYADKSFWVNSDGDTVAEVVDLASTTLDSIDIAKDPDKNKSGYPTLREYLKQHILEDYDPDEPDEDVPERVRRLTELAEHDNYDLSDYAEEEFEIRLVHIKYEDRYTGMFLTEQACETHIKENHYHYKNPRSYVMHAWRNPELEQLLEILGALVGQPYIKH